MRKFAVVAVSFLVGFFACYVTRKSPPPPQPPPEVRTVIALDEFGQWAADLTLIGQSFNEDGSLRVFVRAAKP